MNDNSSSTSSQNKNPNFDEIFYRRIEIPRAEGNIQKIHELIETRRSEIESVGKQLAKEGNRRAILASVVRAVVIFLGALVAIKEVANQFIGSSNIANTITFAIVGVLIATLTGFETAFKWQDTSTELNNLAAESRDVSRKAGSTLIVTEEDILQGDKTKELKQIMKALDNKISDIQKRAAKLGIETVSLNNMYGKNSIRTQGGEVKGLPRRRNS